MQCNHGKELRNEMVCEKLNVYVYGVVDNSGNE